MELVQPGHTNPHGTVFGGQVVQWIDLAASLAAQRHCRRMVVTAAIDALSFRAPIHVGEWAVLSAVVNRTWLSSLEVQVAVEAEHPLTGMRRRAVDAYLTFVALGDDGRPVQVPAFVPSTPEERSRWEGAEARRVARLALRAGTVGDPKVVP